jgi:heme o synthase
MRFIKDKARQYWALIKSLQTGLLLITGLTGYISANCPITNWHMLLAIGGSLFLSISGSTVLNMWYDRDIDARMDRTHWRPLPSGKTKPNEAFVLGLILSAAGVIWAFKLAPIYSAVIFAGLFFDVIVYTVWLKRRTCWSIIWGGISGGMPILAGRALATGHLDWIGMALSLAVLFWIPTHMMTFSMRYADDYQKAGVPTFPSRYGYQATRIVIAVSSILAAFFIGIASFGIGIGFGYLRVFGVLSLGLMTLAVLSLIKKSDKVNFGLFKYASLYMLSAMIIMMLGAL